MEAKRQFDEEKRKAERQICEDRMEQERLVKVERRRLEEEKDEEKKLMQIEREDFYRNLDVERKKFEEEQTHDRNTLYMERTKFLYNVKTFEEESQRIQDNNAATASMVEFNVGGILFETSKTTIMQQSQSLLALMCSGRHLVDRDKQGHIFLDRDAELFRVILNFMRNPSVPPQPRDAIESELLVKESKFYKVKFFKYPVVFAVGGHDGSGHLGSMEVLDVINQCWRPCAPMETPRAYFGGGALFNKIHVFGGQNSEFRATTTGESYDVLRGTWEKLAPLMIPRRNCAGIAAGDRLFCVGGFDGTSILSHVEAYDARMKNWMPLAHLTTPRSSAAISVYSTEGTDQIYVMGGTSGTRLNTVEVYDERANKWSTLSYNMLKARSAATAVGVLGKVFCVGGMDNDQEMHYSMEALDLVNSVEGCRRGWQFCKILSMSRVDAASCVMNDSILLTGGQNGDILSSTEFYRTELDAWNPGPPMLVPRYGHQLLVNHI